MKWTMVLTLVLVDVLFFGVVEAEWVTTGALRTPRSHSTSTLLPSGKVLAVGGWNGIALSDTAIYDPNIGMWSDGGSLATARYSHTATLLPSGKVLVVGGYRSHTLSSAEIYDPRTGAWTHTGGFATPREQHTATLLPSGRVLVVGGREATGNQLSSAEIYDPSTGTWSHAGNLNTPRTRHTATLLPSGRVLVIGGYNGSELASAESYDPHTATWFAVGALTTPRERHTATLLASGEVLVVGGRKMFSAIASVEIFAPSTGTWSDAQDLAARRYSHTATLLPSGKVLVAGGVGIGPVSSTEIYDPNTGTWMDAGDLLTPRFLHTATLLPAGKIVVAGGTEGDDGGLVSSVEIYDSSTGTWSDTGDLAASRSQHTATLLPSSGVLVVGGYDGSYLAGAETYDPSSGTWSDAGGLDTPRSRHTATLLPTGKVLIVGGYDGSYLSSVETYDPTTGTWSDTEGLATPRGNHTATLLASGEVLVVGGRPGPSPTPSVEIYDPTTETWADAESLAVPRTRHTATLLISGKVLVTGGDGDPFGAEIYDPITGTWTDTGDLIWPRSRHQATLLPSGEVLVAGSLYAGFTAEIYDPSAGAWTDTGRQTTDRRNLHTLTLLPSGKALAIGGFDGIDHWSSTENFDPGTGTWTDAGDLGAPRSGHTSTLLPSGKVLVAGGYNGAYLSSAELYEIAPPPDARRPTIHATPQNLRYGEAFTITGLFRGDSEASGSGTRSSAVNYPIIHLRSWDGSEHHTLIPDPQPNFWDAPRTLTVSHLPPGINVGRHLLTVSVAGVFSEPVPVTVECSLAITAQPTDQVAFLGENATFTVEAQGGRFFQWKRNGIEIPGATGPTYTTPPITAADDGTHYSVCIGSGCTSEQSEAAELIIDDDIPPEAEVTYPTGGEFWLPGELETITWAMSDNVRICLVAAELTYSNDSGTTWSSAGTIGTFGDTQNCPFPGEQTTSLAYTVPSSPPSGEPGFLYKIRIQVTDRAGNTTVAESEDPFFMLPPEGGGIRTLILTNPSRIDTTPDLSLSLQNLANHPTVQGIIVNFDEVTTIDALYDAWDAETATANDVLFAEGGIHDHILSLLDVYPQVEHLIVVGDDSVIPMTRLEDRTVRLPESEYANEVPASTVQQALSDNNYLSDDPLATRHALRPDRLNDTTHLADLGIGRLVETPEEISAAIDAYIQQDGILDQSLRDPKALITGYDFLQDSARRIRSHWQSTYTPDDVDGELIGSDWGVPTVPERRNLLTSALAQAPGFISLNSHATHAEEGVPGIDRFDIQGQPADDIAALDLSGCVVYAIGCHGGLPVPGEADLPQSFLGAGASAYLAGSGYGWGLLQGIGLAERFAVFLTEELTAPGSQTISGAIRRGKARYYRESPRWHAYDIKTLHQPILYGFPTYILQADTSQSDSEPPVRVVRTPSRGPLPPHITSLQLAFDLSIDGLYQKYDIDGLPTVDCPPEGCYYGLNGLAISEPDLPFEPYFPYNSSLAGTSQHGILWLGGPYFEEDEWTPIFGRIASNDPDDIGLGSTPPRIIIPPRGPRPISPQGTGDSCPVQDDEVGSVVVTTGELAQAATDDPGEYSLHRLTRELDLEIFYFNNPDDPSTNCDREGPIFGDDPTHELLGTTLHWSVDVQDDAGIWRVLVVWDDQQEARWTPLELSYDDTAERWIGSLPVAGRQRLTYVLQAVDRRGNVAWKEFAADLPPSGIPLDLPDPIEVQIGAGEADLELTLVAPSEVNAGADFAATLTVTNHGPDPATQLTTTLTLPPGMLYVFASGDGWTCSLNAPDIVCTRDVLESGGTSDIFIQLIAPESGGEVVLTACVDAAESAPSEPNCDNARILVLDLSMTDLAIFKDDGGVLAIPGEPIIYSIIVRNLGPNPAPDALVTDNFPPELVDVFWTCTASADSFCTPAGTGDLLDLVEIASGGTLQYTAHAVVDENVSGPVINTAHVEVSPAMEDIDPSNNWDTAITHDRGLIFSDGFESGDCSEWSSCSGLP